MSAGSRPFSRSMSSRSGSMVARSMPSKYDALIEKHLPLAGGDPTRENLIKRTARQQTGLGRAEAAHDGTSCK
jgi:hypothetical protein